MSRAGLENRHALTVEPTYLTIGPMSDILPQKQLPPGAAPASPTEATSMDARVDVLVVTAVKEEYDEALKVDAGALDSWETKPGPIGLDVAFRTYQTKDGGRMRVALTRALEMRGVATVAASAPLIAAYNPRCLAMCGVCAGRRGNVNLGDVIVGDILYTYDTGAIEVEYDADKNRHERFRGEPGPYRLAAIWKQRAEVFCFSDKPIWLHERPRSLDNQGLWLLERLYAGESDPSKHSDRKVMCSAWSSVIDRLRKKGYLTSTGLVLSDAGREYIADILLHHPDGLPPAPDFKVHVAPIATGNNVVRDEKIFERLSDSMRKVLAVEMEAAAIGAIAHVSGIPWMIVMKGVMDHADSEKEDGFKAFAARASAECLIAFLRENLPEAPQEASSRSSLPPAREKGVVSLTRAWNTWAQATRPPIPPSLLVAGRKAELEKLLTWLHQEPSVLALNADTPGEAIAFLYAALGQLSETERDAILNRCYVVEDVEAWRRLEMSAQPLLLIPKFSDRTPIGEAVTRAHHVLLPIGLSEPATGLTLTLPRIELAEAARMLIEAGIAEKHASELSRLARAGLGALRRRLAIHPAALLPAWATPQSARILLPAVLAGSWEDRCPSDQEIIAHLAGRAYAQVREDLIQWASQPDPPIRLVADTTWTVVSAEDSWSLITPYLTSTELGRFKEAFLRVFGELDPALDLPREQRWMAAMHGKVRKFSLDLRRGMAESITTLAAQDEHAAVGPHVSGKEWADRIIQQLLVNCTSWQMWASLCDQLPLLAEAAPEPFLSAVDNDLSSDDPLLAKLFDDTIDPLFHRSPHTGLLWALETLAWSPQYLSDAALALARLARLDPGGRMANRPKESLREIFLLWHPSTKSSLDRRLQVLKTVQQREEEVGWHLLSRLLPDQGIAMSTHKPCRRDWAADKDHKATYGEINRGTSEILKMLLSTVSTLGSRWTVLINVLDKLLPNDRNAVFDALNKLDLNKLPEKEHIQVWAAVRHQLARHLQFAEAEWALPPEDVEKLQSLYLCFEPEDYTKKYGWLFSSRVEIPIAGNYNWQEREETIAKTRREAVKTVFETQGLDGIRTLASEVEQPGELGFSIGSSDIPHHIDAEFLNSALGSPCPALRNTGRSFLVGRSSLQDGQQWLKALRDAPDWQRWSSRQKADYYLCCPFTHETWDMLASEEEEIQKLYWSEVSIWGRGEVGISACERAMDSLSKYGRLVSAVELVSVYCRKNGTKVNPERAISALEAISRSESMEPINQGHFSYTVAELIQELGEDPRADKMRIAKLEWLFLPWFRDHSQPQILNETLREEPSVFVDVLGLIYRAEGEPPSEVSDETRTRAEFGYQLLDKWDHPPGLSEDGQLDGQKLRQWVSRVRELASVSGRSKVADYRIGEILAHLPQGRDGVWPHEEARQLLEEIGGNKHIQQGLVLGVRNSRGVTTRAIGEGGQQERSLAEQYRQYAERLTDSCPRTARLLRELANSYDSDARVHDTRAELDELRWG